MTEKEPEPTKEQTDESMRFVASFGMAGPGWYDIASLLARREAALRAELEAVKKERDDAVAHSAGKCVYLAEAKDAKARVKELEEALKEAWEWVDRSADFYRFQSKGNEFYPNREALEGCSERIRRVLRTEGHDKTEGGEHGG
jgi:hypothetical protein